MTPPVGLPSRWSSGVTTSAIPPETRWSASVWVAIPHPVWRNQLLPDGMGGRPDQNYTGRVASWTRRPEKPAACSAVTAAASISGAARLHRFPVGSTGKSGSAAERWQAFQPFLRWLVAYENQAADTLGAEWRPGCWRAIKRLPKGKPWLPPALALEWWRLAAATGNPPRPKKFLKN